MVEKTGMGFFNLLLVLLQQNHDGDWVTKLADIDTKIGLRIRKARKSRGLSQIELAERIGLSFQQIQKYEKGATRMSAFRLQQISKALDVPIAVFLEEWDRTLNVSGPTIQYGQEEGASEFFQLLDKQEITVLKLFRKLKNKKVREGFLKQLRGLIELEKEG